MLFITPPINKTEATDISEDHRVLRINWLRCEIGFCCFYMAMAQCGCGLHTVMSVVKLVIGLSEHVSVSAQS